MSAIIVDKLSYSVKPHFWAAKRTLLDSLSFEVQRGEIFGFLGPNGAGKTTTIKALLGLVTPEHGTIEILGGDARRPSARQKLGFMPERAYFPEYLTAREIVMQHGILAGLSTQVARQRSNDVLATAGLTQELDQRVRSFSKGMLQRVGLAQALVTEPELVVLDEPMSGLDPLGRRDVRDIMLRLKARGCTVFFSTHILPDVETVCDRLAILIGGRLRRVGPLAELLHDSTAGVEVVAENVTPTALAQAQSLTSKNGARGTAHFFEVDSTAKANDLVDHLRKHHATVISVQPHRRSLEDVFVREASRS